MTRKFRVDYSFYDEYMTSAVIKLDDEVIDRVDDEWREHLYDLKTPEEIAVHICYNMVENNIGLSQMDGWADLPREMAVMVKWPEFDVDMVAQELEYE